MALMLWAILINNFDYELMEKVYSECKISVKMEIKYDSVTRQALSTPTAKLQRYFTELASGEYINDYFVFVEMGDTSLFPSPSSF